MNDAHPYGVRIRFEWDPEDDVDSYEIVVRGPNAARPLVDRSAEANTFTFSSCRSYVADHNLDDWEWRVRARGASGDFGPWSRTGHFRFEPCRVDGRACLAN